ncbi:type II toxin-antitoxin system RelE/ParE family toxin [Minwuia sp.]|uniref:type II toxin-antitoxin system RelE/ParE family toxin n=1 Tax=Minwuia sp. TaxID=2493630 RepID=UPI003A8F284C
MKLVYTRRATRHLAEIWNWITENADERTADGYVDRIHRHCETLIPFPQRGDRKDHILPGLRTIGFERRVVIAFVVIDEMIVVEGILYGGRDIETSFQSRDDT